MAQPGTLPKTVAGPLLAVRHIDKKYGDKSILRDVSLEAHRGQAVVLIGPSGCGKSTLLRTINGLESIDHGEVVFDQRRVSETKTNLTELRRQIGMVFQQFALFPHLTVKENMLLAPRLVRGLDKSVATERAEILLARVGLTSHADSYPKTLSGGQQQRVAIIRALMMEPKLMLFDEVTSALDPELVGEVLDVMRELAHTGMTMIIVTHEMGFARDVGDHVIFMDEGKIIEEGSPKEVLDNPTKDRTEQFLRHIRR